MCRIWKQLVFINEEQSEVTIFAVNRHLREALRA